MCFFSDRQCCADLEGWLPPPILWGCFGGLPSSSANKSQFLACAIPCCFCRSSRQLLRSDCQQHWLLPSGAVVFWCSQMGAEERPPKLISTCDPRQGLNSSFRWKMASVPLAFWTAQLQGSNALHSYWVKCWCLNKSWKHLVVLRSWN